MGGARVRTAVVRRCGEIAGALPGEDDVDSLENREERNGASSRATPPAEIRNPRAVTRPHRCGSFAAAGVVRGADAAVGGGSGWEWPYHRRRTSEAPTRYLLSWCLAIVVDTRTFRILVGLLAILYRSFLM